MSARPEHTDHYQVRRIRNFAWYSAAAWTLLLLASVFLAVHSVVTHSVIWLLGISATALGTRRLIRSSLRQMQIEKELQEQARKLEEEIAERQAVQESLLISEEKLQAQNNELLAKEEVLRIQLNDLEISQKLLKESNSTLKAIFDVSPLPILISSYERGIIRDLNRTFCNAFGYQRTTIIGKNGFDLGIWSDISDRNHFIALMSEQQGISAYPAEIRNVYGDMRSIRMYSSTIDFNHEKCLLILFMDVTDQKRIEDELRQAQKMDVLGQLAGGVAHDFNNMLTAIIGSAEMMERHVKDNPPAEKLLASIREAAGRSAELTSQLLAFSRKRGATTVHVWINKTVSSVMEMLERTIDKSIRLETRLTAERDQVIGDPTQLQNALLNLGINARDAMPNGGTITFSTATVYLDATYCSSHSSHIQPGHYVEISVSDTGIGIHKDIIDHIFEPFFTTKRVGKGAGLGLAAVYSTVKAHQGSVNVYSETGIGTVFKLYLPLATELVSPSSSADSASSGCGGILLVDDELLIREMGQALLEDRGYRVFLAENGEQALAVYERERDNISLVILDVVMPVMGGKDTLQRLIAAYPDIKVLISSGFHQNSTNDSFISLGALGFIQKPYRTIELFKAVDAALKSSV